MALLARVLQGQSRSGTPHWIAAVTLAFLTGLQGCQIVDPLLGDYTVRSEDGVSVKVIFRGGEGVSRVRQRDIIQDFLLDLSADSSRESTIFDAMLELEGLFETNGFPLVSVVHTVQAQGDQVQVEFDIDQGPLVSVEELVITGNTSVDSETLGNYWSRRRTAAFGFGENLYVLAELVSLTDSIQAHYRRLGYLDVESELSGPEPLLSPTTDKVRVSISITEGSRYSVGAVETDPQLVEVISSDAPPPPRPDPRSSPPKSRTTH